MRQRAPDRGKVETIGSDGVNKTRKNRMKLAATMAAVTLAANTALAQKAVDVGNCTPGDLKCAADIVLVCECYDEWREIDGGDELLTVCVWEDTGEDCGKPAPPPRPPPCNESYEGATFEFTDEIKECFCDAETGCRWRTDY